MAWEKRNSRGRYFYRTQRLGRRFRKIYLGTGVFAETLAAADLQARHERKQVRQEWQHFAQRWADAVQRVEALAAATDWLLRLTLTAAGYHQHGRSTWRKRHGQKET